MIDTVTQLVTAGCLTEVNVTMPPHAIVEPSHQQCWRCPARSASRARSPKAPSRSEESAFGDPLNENVTPLVDALPGGRVWFIADAPRRPAMGRPQSRGSVGNPSVA
jgi:hypothetical protein